MTKISRYFRHTIRRFLVQQGLIKPRFEQISLTCVELPPEFANQTIDPRLATMPADEFKAMCEAMFKGPNECYDDRS